MASLLLRFGLKAASTNVIGLTSAVSAVSRRFPAMSFTIAQLAKVSSLSGRSDEVGEDEIIRASVERSKFPFNTDVQYGKYNFLLRNFLLRMEREEAENGCFLRGNVYPLMSELIDPALYHHPVPPFVRDINAYLLDVYDFEALSYVTSTHAAIPTPSSAMLASDSQLIKVLAKETIVGGIEAAGRAYDSSPNQFDRLIKSGWVRPMVTELISPNGGKDLDARVHAKVSGIGALDADKMVRFFRLFVIPLKTTVAVRCLLSRGD